LTSSKNLNCDSALKSDYFRIEITSNDVFIAGLKGLKSDYFRIEMGKEQELILARLG